MREDPPNAHEVQMHEFAIKQGLPTKPFRPRVEINTPLEHAQHALRNFGTSILPTLLEKRLKHLESYKAALSLMPNLQDVKALSQYRKSHPKYNKQDVLNEINLHGKPLSKGQILFHGGNYPRNENTGEIQREFITNRPLSTSLCAQVAAVHGTYHDPQEIWIIKNINSSVRAFVFSNSKKQKHSHETEVLVAQGAKISIQNMSKLDKFTIYEVLLQ